MLPGVSALTGENLNREGFNPLVTFYVMTRSQYDTFARLATPVWHGCHIVHTYTTRHPKWVSRGTHTLARTTSAQTKTDARLVHDLCAEEPAELQLLPADVRREHTRKAQGELQKRVPRDGDT